MHVAVIAAGGPETQWIQQLCLPGAVTASKPCMEFGSCNSYTVCLQLPFRMHGLHGGTVDCAWRWGGVSPPLVVCCRKMRTDCLLKVRWQQRMLRPDVKENMSPQEQQVGRQDG